MLNMYKNQDIKSSGSNLNHVQVYGKGRNKTIFTNKKKIQKDSVNEILGFKVLKILDSNEWHLL